MRVLVTLVALLGLFAVLASSQEEVLANKGSLLLVNSTDVTSYLAQISYVVDGVGFYFSGQTPTEIWVVNLTALSGTGPDFVQGTNATLSHVALAKTDGDSISAMNVVGQYVYTAGYTTLSRFELSNLAADPNPQLSFPGGFRPTHSFTSSRNNTVYMYFTLSDLSTGGEGLPIIRVNTQEITSPVEEERYQTYFIPDAQNSVYSIATGVNYTYLIEQGDGDSSIVREWSFEVENVTRVFIINQLDASQAYFSETENKLYIGGTHSDGNSHPIIVSVDLGSIVDGTSYNLDFTTCNTTKACNALAAITPVRAVEVDTNPDMYCTAIGYDNIMGAIFGGFYDGYGVGSVLRINKLFMITVDPYIFLEDSRKPTTINLVTEDRIVYATSDLNVYYTIYPTVCPDNCYETAGRGTCLDGTCVCTEGYISENCNELACDSDCGESEGRGTCNNGVCNCAPTFTGANCTEARCPNDCFESSGRGVCGGAASGWTCTCNSLWTNEPGGVQDCSVQTFLTCNARTDVEDCVKTAGCGWCVGTGRCQTGNVVGPSAGNCEEWLVGNTREIGTFVVAIIFIVIFGIMVLLNMLSAMVVDYQTASLLNAENLLTVEFLKETYWRDERSAKAWKLFDQLQFIAYYPFLGAAFPTRVIGLTRYFNWAMLLLPLPFYQDASDHPERTIGGIGTGSKRSILNAEQIAGSLLIGPEQLFYAVMFWFLILFAICMVIYGIFALIFWLIYRGKEPNIGTVLAQKVFYVITRIVMIAYMPVCITASYHLKSGYGAVAVASAIALVVVGILPIIFNAIVVWGKTKELLFLYLKLRFGALYSVYHYEKARFNLVVLLRKLLVAVMLGFLAVNSTLESTMIYAQVGVIIFIYVAYIVAVFIIRPYLDQVHLVTDVACCIFNAIAVGISLITVDPINENQPTPSAQVGEIIAAICVLLSFAMCVVAFGHSWYNMTARRTSPLILCRGVPKPGEGIYEDDPEANKNAAELENKKKEESSSEDNELESSGSSSESEQPQQQEDEPEEAEEESAQEESAQEESAQEESAEDEAEDDDEEEDDGDDDDDEEEEDDDDDADDSSN